MYTMLTAIHENIQLLNSYETTLQQFISHSSSEQQWRLELANQDLLHLYFVLAQAPWAVVTAARLSLQSVYGSLL